MNTNALHRTLHTTHCRTVMPSMAYEEEVEQERLAAGHAARKPLTAPFEKLLKGALIGNC